MAFAQNSIQNYYYTQVMTDLFVSATGPTDGAPAFGSCTSMDNIWDVSPYHHLLSLITVSVVLSSTDPGYLLDRNIEFDG